MYHKILGTPRVCRITVFERDLDTQTNGSSMMTESAGTAHGVVERSKKGGGEI